jgi:effector-binding domain-containing protein
MHRLLRILFILVVGTAAYAVPVTAGESCGCHATANDSSSTYSDEGCSCGAQAQANTADAAELDKQSGAALPTGHLESPVDLQISMRGIDPITVAFVEGTFADDIPALFSQLMAAAGEQGLFTDHSQVLSVYQGSLNAGATPETPFQAGISVADGTAVSEPLLLQTLAGGQYMVVEHWGSYEQLADTYARVIEWAMESGIEFRTGPSFEVYVTDPESAPEEEWLTEIYLPFDHNV